MTNRTIFTKSVDKCKTILYITYIGAIKPIKPNLNYTKGNTKMQTTTQILTPSQAEKETDNGLRRMVENIARQLTEGLDQEDAADYAENGEEFTAWDYLRDALDINWILNNDRTYKGARVLVAFGGPNIWIDTVNEQVEGYWWGDKWIVSYNDAIELDSTLEQLFNC